MQGQPQFVAYGSPQQMQQAYYGAPPVAVQQMPVYGQPMYGAPVYGGAVFSNAVAVSMATPGGPPRAAPTAAQFDTWARGFRNYGGLLCGLGVAMVLLSFGYVTGALAISLGAVLLDAGASGDKLAARTINRADCCCSPVHVKGLAIGAIIFACLEGAWMVIALIAEASRLANDRFVNAAASRWAITWFAIGIILAVLILAAAAAFMNAPLGEYTILSGISDPAPMYGGQQQQQLFVVPPAPQTAAGVSPQFDAPQGPQQQQQQGQGPQQQQQQLQQQQLLQQGQQQQPQSPPLTGAPRGVASGGRPVELPRPVTAGSYAAAPARALKTVD